MRVGSKNLDQIKSGSDNSWASFSLCFDCYPLWSILHICLFSYSHNLISISFIHHHYIIIIVITIIINYYYHHHLTHRCVWWVPNLLNAYRCLRCIFGTLYLLSAHFISFNHSLNKCKITQMLFTLFRLHNERSSNIYAFWQHKALAAFLYLFLCFLQLINLWGKAENDLWCYKF